MSLRSWRRTIQLESFTMFFGSVKETTSQHSPYNIYKAVVSGCDSTFSIAWSALSVANVSSAPLIAVKCWGFSSIVLAMVSEVTVGIKAWRQANAISISLSSSPIQTACAFSIEPTNVWAKYSQLLKQTRPWETARNVDLTVEFRFVLILTAYQFFFPLTIG